MKQNELEQIIEEALSRFEIAYFHIKIAVNRYVSEVYGDDSKKEGKKQLENMKSWIETELERTYTKAFKAGQEQAVLEERERWIKAVKIDRPIFIKDNYVSLVEWHLTEKEILTIRKILRIEILEDMGIDCTDMRNQLKTLKKE